MDKPNKKNILLYILWGIVVISLIIVIVFSFIIREKINTNLFLELLGVSAMLAIALQTFLEMNKSTKKTIKTVSEAAQKQIEELKKTNIILDSVSKSLKIVSEDVVIKSKEKPNLFLTFKKIQEKITLNAGKECEVEFWLNNTGPVGAHNTYLRVFFSPDVEITDKGNFDGKMLQDQKARYEGHTGLYKYEPIMEFRTHKALKIKIKTESTDSGLVEINYSCSSDLVSEKTGKLFIYLIG